jgi:hypothetical protein
MTVDQILKNLKIHEQPNKPNTFKKIGTKKQKPKSEQKRAQRIGVYARIHTTGNKTVRGIY